MKLKAPVTLQPRLHLRMLVRAIVVHHQVQRYGAGKFAIDATQEVQKFLVAMATIALADDFALQKLKRREQTRGAMALVVMRHRTHPALLQRQPRLRAIE